MPRILFVVLAVAAFGAGLLSVGNASAQSDPLDCEDYASQADAQAAYRADPSDPADNDGDDDGIACELFEFQDPTTDLTPIGEEPDEDEDQDDADEDKDDEESTDEDEEATETPAAVGAATGTLPASGTGSAIASSLGGTDSALLLSLLGAAAVSGVVALRGIRNRA